MRRAAVFLMGLVLVTASPAWGQPMEPYGGVDQSGFSMWIERRGNSGTMYMAWGGRGVDSFGFAELPAFGVVGKGPCRFGKHGGSCWATGTVKTLGVADFSMDPLLSSGHMTLKAAGFTHTVDWTGRGDPQADSSQTVDDGQRVGAWMYRRAGVAATLYGKKMKGDRLISAMGNSVYADSGMGLRFMPDGTARIRVAIGRDGRIR